MADIVRLLKKKMVETSCEIITSLHISKYLYITKKIKGGESRPQGWKGYVLKINLCGKLAELNPFPRLSSR